MKVNCYSYGRNLEKRKENVSEGKDMEGFVKVEHRSQGLHVIREKGRVPSNKDIHACEHLILSYANFCGSCVG